jgi:hypothetical protein
MPSYRLSASIAGVERSSSGLHIIQIAAGEVLTLPKIDRESGLIDLVFQGRNIAVFAQDLRVRTSPIDEPTRRLDAPGEFEPNV